jgi:hypothetical protein
MDKHAVNSIAKRRMVKKTVRLTKIKAKADSCASIWLPRVMGSVA